MAHAPSLAAAVAPPALWWRRRPPPSRGRDCTSTTSGSLLVVVVLRALGEHSHTTSGNISGFFDLNLQPPYQTQFWGSPSLPHTLQSADIICESESLTLRHTSAPPPLAGQESAAGQPPFSAEGVRRSGSGCRTQWRPTSNLRLRRGREKGIGRKETGTLYRHHHHLTTVAMS